MIAVFHHESICNPLFDNQVFLRMLQGGEPVRADAGVQRGIGVPISTHAIAGNLPPGGGAQSPGGAQLGEDRGICNRCLGDGDPRVPDEGSGWTRSAGMCASWLSVGERGDLVGYEREAAEAIA